MAGQRFEFGAFVLDTASGTLTRNGLPAAIGTRGMALLVKLLSAKDEVVSKAALMDAAWPGLAVEESNLSVQIAALRKLLGPSPTGGEWITTVPRVGYRWLSDTSDGSPPSAARPDRSDRPTVAVLPFTNVSSDPEQDYLAGGITEDVITALARFRWFSVIGRIPAQEIGSADPKQVGSDLGVRYLLQGSIRRSGQRMRISVRLVDAQTGVHVWAERYNVEMTEVFAVQDEIAERVAGAMEPELLKTEAALAASRHTGNMTAWDLVRRARGGSTR